MHILRWMSRRVGPDPYPSDTDKTVFNIDDSTTWCLNTWSDERPWKAPYLACALLINCLNTCMPRYVCMVISHPNFDRLPPCRQERGGVYS